MQTTRDRTRASGDAGLWTCCRSWHPEINPWLFYTSIVIAPVVTAFVYGWAHPTPGHSRMLLLVTKWADPAIAQGLSMIAAALIVLSSSRIKQGDNLHAKRAWALSVVIPVAWCLLMLVLERLLKPAFGNAVPSPGATESYATKFLERHDFEGMTSAPSGYALRQIGLLMLFLSHWFGTKWPSHMKPRLLGVAVLALSGYVAWVRVYRGMHTVFDISVAVTIGVYLYWVLHAAAQYGYAVFGREEAEARYGWKLCMGA